LPPYFSAASTITRVGINSSFWNLLARGIPIAPFCHYEDKQEAIAKAANRYPVSNREEVRKEKAF